MAVVENDIYQFLLITIVFLYLHMNDRFDERNEWIRIQCKKKSKHFNFKQIGTLQSTKADDASKHRLTFSLRCIFSAVCCILCLLIPLLWLIYVEQKSLVKLIAFTLELIRMKSFAIYQSSPPI